MKKRVSYLLLFVMILQVFIPNMGYSAEALEEDDIEIVSEEIEDADISKEDIVEKADISLEKEGLDEGSEAVTSTEKLGSKIEVNILDPYVENTSNNIKFGANWSLPKDYKGTTGDYFYIEIEGNFGSYPSILGDPKGIYGIHEGNGKYKFAINKYIGENNIKGEFWAEAYIEEGKEITIAGHTVELEKEVVLPGTGGGSGQVEDFKIRKSSYDIAYDVEKGEWYIDWFIYIGTRDNRVYNSDLIDEIEESLELDINSVKGHYKNYIDESKSIGHVELKDGGNWNSEAGNIILDNIEIKENKLGFKIKDTSFQHDGGDSVNNKQLTITYRTYIKDTSKPSYTNTVKILGGIEASGSHSLKWKSGGSDSADKRTHAEFNIEKIDFENNNIRLEGAIFNILDNSGNLIKEKLKTNKNGRFEENILLLPGIYQLIEVDAPKDYEKSKDAVKVEITPENIGVDKTEVIKSITNTKKVPLIPLEPSIPILRDIKIEKVWKDSEGKLVEGKGSVEINLLENGSSTGLKLRLDESTDWKGAFVNLPKYKDGEKVDYTVKEVELEGYISEISGSMEEGFIVTNTKKVPLTPLEPSIPILRDIKIEKVWKDSEGKLVEGKGSVEINLLENGSSTGLKLRLDESTDWKGAFDNLPKYKDGEEVKYTVVEGKLEGYRSDISGTMEEGFTVTNTKIVPLTPLEPSIPAIEEEEDPGRPIDPWEVEDKEEPKSPDPLEEDDSTLVEGGGLDREEANSDIEEDLKEEDQDIEDSTEVKGQSIDKNTKGEDESKMASKGISKNDNRNKGENLPRTGNINNYILVLAGIFLAGLGLNFRRRKVQ